MDRHKCITNQWRGAASTDALSASHFKRYVYVAIEKFHITMAYDEGLAERLQDYFEGRSDVEIKKMFGGLCFMVSNHTCCGIVGDTLMVRVGPEKYQECLKKKHAREMDFTGRAMKGMVYVSPEGFESDSELESWVGICESFVQSLPPKHIKGKKA